MHRGSRHLAPALGLMNGTLLSWPADADGDVFRRLQVQGFNFAVQHAIDFEVEFNPWPPPATALNLLLARHPKLEVIEPELGASGYVAFQVFGNVSYELVTSVQRSTSSLVAQFGGACESWGVLSS